MGVGLLASSWEYKIQNKVILEKTTPLTFLFAMAHHQYRVLWMSFSVVRMQYPLFCKIVAPVWVLARFVYYQDSHQRSGLSHGDGQRHILPWLCLFFCPTYRHLQSKVLFKSQLDSEMIELMIEILKWFCRVSIKTSLTEQESGVMGNEWYFNFIEKGTFWLSILQSIYL